jgi:hypothetical protein
MRCIRGAAAVAERFRLVSVSVSYPPAWAGLSALNPGFGMACLGPGPLAQAEIGRALGAMKGDTDSLAFWTNCEGCLGR